jgi:hypothetical protein
LPAVRQKPVARSLAHAFPVSSARPAASSHSLLQSDE